jgi:SPOR domain
MASEAVRRRTKAERARSVARARREKVMLGVGVLVLAVLLAVEGPKTLKRVQGGSSSPAPATATTTTAPQQTATTSSAADLKTIAKLPAKDPFVPQLGTNGTPSPGPTLATPPRVRTAHFVAKDLFRQQLGVTASASAASAPALATPPKVSPVKSAAKSTSAPKVVKVVPLTSVGNGTVVIVASVAVSQGQAAADKAAAQARSRGVTNVHVALSSASSTQRTGYFAVYTGPYSTSAAASKALGSVGKAGYTSAYTRHLGH